MLFIYNDVQLSFQKQLKLTTFIPPWIYYENRECQKKSSILNLFRLGGLVVVAAVISYIMIYTDYYEILTCKLRYGEACTNLGYNYHTGKGVDQNINKAISFYEKACELHDGEGCYNLGVYYENGEGVAMSIDKANSLYIRACRLGFSEACDVMSM